MPRQIKTLIRLELSNIFSLNVLRHTKNPKEKRKAYLMAGVYGFLILLVFLYMGGMSYGLTLLGAGAVVPAYLIAIASIFIFFFGTFTAGASLFSRNGYDILCSLPVSRTAIAVSRFVRMYAENLVLTLAVMVPGMGVYAVLQQPNVGFYLTSVMGIFTVPLLPVAAAALVGALITGISSKMKHKSLVEAGLSILLVVGIFCLTPGLAGMEGNITPEMLTALSDKVLEALGTVYPPAAWLGTAIVTGNIMGCLGCAGVSAVGFLVVVAFVSLRFHSICRQLFSSSAKHDYRMERLKQNSLLVSLCGREFRRYFASGVYVSNTIMGPILGTVLSGALFFTGKDRIEQILAIPIDISGLVPFLVGGVFCMMTAACVSISMEGKNFWIVKTLPIPTKTILDAKILMNLLLMLPFYLVSETFLILALKPDILGLIWLLVIPAVIALFSCVYGVTVNLRLPVLDWESEVSVVKQSAASLLGGMGGLLLAILWAAVTVLLPKAYSDFGKLAVSAVLLMITAILYGRNNRTDLKEL